MATIEPGKEYYKFDLKKLDSLTWQDLILLYNFMKEIPDIAITNRELFYYISKRIQNSFMTK